jgi:hypothetical protein
MLQKISWGVFFFFKKNPRLWVVIQKCGTYKSGKCGCAPTRKRLCGLNAKNRNSKHNARGMPSQLLVNDGANDSFPFQKLSVVSLLRRSSGEKYLYVPVRFCSRPIRFHPLWMTQDWLIGRPYPVPFFIDTRNRYCTLCFSSSQPSPALYKFRQVRVNITEGWRLLLVYHASPKKQPTEQRVGQRKQQISILAKNEVFLCLGTRRVFLYFSAVGWNWGGLALFHEGRFGGRLSPTSNIGQSCHYSAHAVEVAVELLCTV